MSRFLCLVRMGFYWLPCLFHYCLCEQRQLASLESVSVHSFHDKCVCLLFLHIYSLSFLWTLNSRHGQSRVSLKQHFGLAKSLHTEEHLGRRAPAPCLLHLLCSAYVRHALPAPTQDFSVSFCTTRVHALQGFRHPSGPVESLQLGQHLEPPPPSRERGVRGSRAPEQGWLLLHLCLRASAPYALLSPCESGASP